MSKTTSIVITVNGQSREVAEHSSLLDLLAILGLDPRAVVVEHNRAIVRRPALDNTALCNGDQVELVHFVGGG